MSTKPFFYKEDDLLLQAVAIDIFNKTKKLTGRRRFLFSAFSDGAGERKNQIFFPSGKDLFN